MAQLRLTGAQASDDAVINDAGYEDNSPDSAGTCHVTGDVGSSPTAANSGQGWRFPGVTLSSTDTVTSAYLELTKKGDQWTTVNWRLTALDEDNTATFSSGSPPGSRAIVSASIAVESLNDSHTNGVVYQHPKDATLQVTIAAAIQAVIGRVGWASGNALAIVNQSKQDGSQGSGFSRENYNVYEDTTPSGCQPVLVINYTPAVSGTMGYLRGNRLRPRIFAPGLAR